MAHYLRKQIVPCKAIAQSKPIFAFVKTKLLASNQCIYRFLITQQYQEVGVEKL